MDTLNGSSPDWSKCGRCIHQDKAGNAYPCIDCTDDNLKFQPKLFVGHVTVEDKAKTMAKKKAPFTYLGDGMFSVESKLGGIPALDTQVGGSHYQMPIQPIEFIVKNDIPYREGNAIKYICRHKKKNGKQDIEKAIHYLQMVLEDYE